MPDLDVPNEGGFTMRAQMPLALFALVLGTLEAAGGAQEMI